LNSQYFPFEKSKDQEPNFYNQSQIIDEYCFSTKTFMIRYYEEEIELNELCQFRMEIDASSHNSESELFFECQLMFADMSKIGQPSNKDGVE
jgi:hypothetical protein